MLPSNYIILFSGELFETGLRLSMLFLLEETWRTRIAMEGLLSRHFEIISVLQRERRFYTAATIRLINTACRVTLGWPTGNLHWDSALRQRANVQTRCVPVVKKQHVCQINLVWGSKYSNKMSNRGERGKGWKSGCSTNDQVFLAAMSLSYR